MITTVQIANLALLRAMTTAQIDDLSEPSKEAQVCNAFMDQCRDLILESHDWPFARKRTALALSGTAPTGWLYSYAIPADCVRSRSIADSLTVRPADRLIPFVIEGTLIYTNQVDAILVYTTRITDAQRFAPSFADALSYLLSAEIAVPLQLDLKAAERNRQLSEQKRLRALADARNAEQQPNDPPDSFTGSR